MKQRFKNNAKRYWVISVRLTRPEIIKFDCIMKIRNGKTGVESQLTNSAVLHQLLRNWIADNEHSEKPFPTQTIERLDI